MSYDWTISIFGKARNGEALWDVANAAAAEGRIGWTEDFDADALPSMLDEAERNGEALVLTASDTTDAFGGLKDALRDAGLSYVVFVGDTGAEGYTNGVSWHPGLDGEVDFLLNGDDPVLEIAKVREAAGAGLAAVNALVEATENAVKAGKVEVTPEAKAEFAEHTGYAWPASDPQPLRV